jgi:hypothetical protein
LILLCESEKRACVRIGNGRHLHSCHMASRLSGHFTTTLSEAHL